MKKNKLFFTIMSCMFIPTLIGCGCAKQNISNEDIKNDNVIQIQSNNVNDKGTDLNNKNKFNKIKKVENNKVYLENDTVIDTSKYSLLGSTSISAIKNNPSACFRLFTFNYDGKNMYYIYEKPIKENVTVNEDLKGVTIEGILMSKTKTSLQIKDDNAYTVSLNCIVYDSNNECKDYRDIFTELDTDILIKAVVIDKEIVNIKIF